MKIWLPLLVLLHANRSHRHHHQQHVRHQLLARGWNPQPGGDVTRIIDRAADRAGSSPRVRDELVRASRTLEAAAIAAANTTAASSSSSSSSSETDIPSQRWFERSSFLRLDYGIFRGASALRRERDGCDNDRRADELLRMRAELPRACLALLLLLEGRGDEAHEVVLGVTMENFRQAEHAATHPPSNWSRLHPMSDDDDMVHSVIHRWEGGLVGEGNHTGWENAKYWATGGPKALDGPGLAAHPVRRALAALAADRAPRLSRRGAMAPPEPRREPRHQVLADGGSHRPVSLPHGCWDPVAFIDLKRQLSLSSSLLEAPAASELLDDACCWREVCAVECLEISLLIRCTLLRRAGLTSQEILEELLQWK